MSTIDEGELDRLEGLYAAATPGEWLYRPARYDDWGYVRAEDHSIVLVGRAGRDTDEDELNAHRREGTDPYGPNALFAVAAHESFPALLAAARALSAEKAAREEAERKAALAEYRLQTFSMGAEVEEARYERALTTAEAETARLRERVGELEGALAPFANDAPRHGTAADDTPLDGTPYEKRSRLTVGDLRRAAAIRSRENNDE